LKKIRIKNIDIGEEWLEGENFLVSKETYRRFHEQLDKESDRSCVLVVIAIIDNILRERLQRKCVQADPKSIKKIFDAGGSFSSFFQKVEWLYCTGDIPKLIRDDLHVLRELRNQCAHNWQGFALDQSIEDEFLKRMHSYEWIENAKEFILETEKKRSTHIVEIDQRLQFAFISSVLISTLNAVDTKTIDSSKGVKP
jgi:hypothetical protein